MTEKAKPTDPAGCRIRNHSASLSREVPRTFEDFPARWSSLRKFSSAKLFCAQTFSSSSKHQEILSDKFSRVTKPPVQVHAVFLLVSTFFLLTKAWCFFSVCVMKLLSSNPSGTTRASYFVERTSFVRWEKWKKKTSLRRHKISSLNFNTKSSEIRKFCQWMWVGFGDSIAWNAFYDFLQPRPNSQTKS